MKSNGKLRSFIFFGIMLSATYWSYSQGMLNPLMKGFDSSRKNGPVFSSKDFNFKPAELRKIRQTVLATGTVTLETGAEVKIGSRISGQLEELYVKIGDFIKAGDVIAVVEHSDLLARVEQRKADLQAEQARLEKTRNEGPLQINKIGAELEELHVQKRLAKKMLQRNKELNEQGVVSTTVLDESQEDLEVLNAKIKSNQESLKLKETELTHDIQLIEASVAKAEANLMEQEAQLSYATITAPIDGIVATISTQKGETVAASFNSPTFVNLIDLRKLEVTVFVDETDIGRVKEGQTAEFTVDSYPKKFFEGKVRDIHPKAIIKDNVVNYEALLKIGRDSIDLLRPEMTANVVITTDTKDKALVILKKAIKRKGKKEFAIIQTGRELSERAIKTGWRDGKFIEVVSGLREGVSVGTPIKPEPGKDKKRRRRG